MALLYCTGFDRGTDLSFYKIYSANNADIVGGGRTNNALRLQSTIDAANLRINITGNDYSELIAGCAVKFHGNSGYKDIIRFMNYNSQANVTIHRGSGAGYLAIGLRDTQWIWTSLTLSNYVWYYIEVKAKFHNTNGYVIVKVNGLEVFNQTNLNTAYSSSILSSRYIWLKSEKDEVLYDDFYVCDTTGTKNNNFLGDISVKTIRPTRDGTYNDFSVVGAGSRYEAVDESNPDYDTSYVTESGSGLKQTFGFSAPSIEGSVLGVIHNAVMRKDGSSEFVRLLAKYNTTTTSGEIIALSDTYQNYSVIYPTRLNSSEDWSVNDLNSLELGVVIE
ncbi:MAG: hypothetical protein ACUVT3_02965 [Ignavibacterium sp.]